MLQSFYRKASSFLLLFILVNPSIQINSQTQSQQLENLKAFTKLYGYIRFFHPSDEASQIDWNKFAVYGIEQVKNAKNESELKEILKELFYPIAPTIQINSSNERTKEYKELIPEDTSDLKVVAWQHLGVGLTEKSNAYKSIRLNRNLAFSPSENEPDFGLISQAIDADKWRGKEIKLKAFVKCDVGKESGRGQLWLRVDKENNQMGFFDNMQNRPILLNKWREYEITGLVDQKANRIVFGAFLKGYGKMWIDNFQIFIRDEENDWKEFKIENNGFENSINNKPKFWGTNTPGYNYYIDKNEKVEGEQSLLVEKKLPNSMSRLFDQYPNIGEVINEELIPDLYCSIPLALYSNSMGTLGKNESYPLEISLNELDRINFLNLTADDENVRLANVVITWNVLQHFYPYFDLEEIDWYSILDETLKESLLDKNSEDHYFTLNRMIARLQDGHGFVLFNKGPVLYGLPLHVQLIENRVVVVFSEIPSIQKGDIILKVGNRTADEELVEKKKLVAGSPQFKLYRALIEFGNEINQDDLMVELLRNGKRFVTNVSKKPKSLSSFYSGQNEFNYEPIKKIDDDIYYINLIAADDNKFYDSLNNISNAKAVIFDYRRTGKFSKDTKRLITLQMIMHLIDSTLQSPRWNIPSVIYPDRKDLSFKESNWKLQPNQPKIKGKKVFIIDSNVISHMETFMSFVEFYKLGDIIGQPSAGCNGNVNYIPLIGGFEFMFTGMKVLKHDGSQYHLIGIQPTHSVKRTIQAVKEGRDEYLEKAMEIIKLSINN